MAPTKKTAPKSTAKKAPSTVKKAAAKRPGMPPRHDGPTSSRKISNAAVGGAVGGSGPRRSPSTNEKGLAKVHCHAIYQYLTDPDQKSKKTIKCADGRVIKNLQGFEVGPVVFGLPQDHCVLYNARTPLPTDHDEDGKWLTTISIERLNGLLASMGDFDVDSKYTEECIDHFVKALIAAVNKKYVVGKDRLKDVGFFHAIVKDKMTHHKDGVAMTADHEEWTAAQKAITMLAETTTSIASLANSMETNFATTEKNFTLLPRGVVKNLIKISDLESSVVTNRNNNISDLQSSVVTNRNNISDLQSGHSSLVSRQDSLEAQQEALKARLDAMFATPVKAKAAFAKKDRSDTSYDNLMKEEEDDFDADDEEGTPTQDSKYPASPKATTPSPSSSAPSTPSWILRNLFGYSA